MKLTKIAVGWYANEDGTWAVVGDAPGEVATKLEADGGDLFHVPGINTGCSTQREWQVVRDAQGRLREDNHAGTTEAWVDTLREGRAYLARRVQS